MNPNILAVIKKIDDIRIDGNTPYWNISAKTGTFLNELAKSRNAKTILEIGTSIGYSGLYLAEAASHNNGHLFTIESHKERFATAKKHFDEAGLSPYITQIAGHAPEVFSNIKIPNIDFCFFDATKAEHISYIKAVEELLAENAIVITDNILSHKADMQPFIDYMMNHEKFTSNIEPIGTGLLISVKN